MKNFYVEPSLRVVDMETEAVMQGGSPIIDGNASADGSTDLETQQHEIWGGSSEDIWK